MFPTFADILASDSAKVPQHFPSSLKIVADDGAESTASGGNSEPPTSPELPSKFSSESMGSEPVMQQTPQTATSTPAPTTCPPGLPSAGSVGHSAGQCNPCCFHPRGRCVNGQSCSFCHFSHEKRRRKKRSGESAGGKEAQESVGGFSTPLNLAEATSPTMSNLSSMVSTPCMTPLSQGLPGSPQRVSQPPPFAAPAYPAPNMEPQGPKTGPPPPMYPPVPAYHSLDEASMPFPGDAAYPRSPPPMAPPSFGVQHQDVSQKVDMNFVPAAPPPGLGLDSLLRRHNQDETSCMKATLSAPPGLGTCPPGLPPIAPPSAPPSIPAPSLDALLGLGQKYSDMGGHGLEPVEKRPAKVELTTTICNPVWLSDPKSPAKVPMMDSCH